MRFSKIILIGSGKIACDCVQHLTTIVEIDKICVLESQENTISMLSRLCQKAKIKYSMTLERSKIENYILDEIKGEKSLIISANNRFIFPPRIINSDYTEIINFHYALLPDYRGMNIPTWVIFNGEKRTGVTWHYVTEQIDCGRIIVQRDIPIEEETTAFDITRQGMVLGIAAFRSFIGELLEKKIPGKEVIYPKEGKIYYNSQLPMHGVLDVNLPTKTMACLLRSFDYGRMQVVPELSLEYLGKHYSINRYQIEKVPGIIKRNYQFMGDRLIIQDIDEQITLHIQEKTEIDSGE